MKVLGVSGSPRKDGNTEILLREALSGAAENGAETEFVTVRNKNISPCQGCLSCWKTGKCSQIDAMDEIYESLIASEGIILASPVYLWSVTGQMKVLLDRTYALHVNGKLVNKVGGIIVVGTRTGISNTVDLIQHFFVQNHVISAGYVDALAKGKGSVRRDERGMKGSFELGKKINKIIKQGYRFPEEYDLPLSKYIERKYRIKAPYPKI